jgi:Na+/melibiose symporter-like transporter
VGATATNLKHRAISSFLVIFYNQVVGLPAQMVGAILMTALVFDAVLDPLLGQISDNWRSRWGRRHPFMLVSAAPYAAAFFFLWNPPPGWSDGALAVYLAICLFSVRFFDTFFEVPHQALAPELAKGYDERTNLIALRQIFVLFGGAGMMVLALQYFLKENSDGSGGVLARDGYFLYSLTGALIIFGAIILSTIGTAHRVPYLSTAPTRPITFRGMLSEAAATLSNRAFIVVSLSGLFVAVAAGAKSGLDIYFGIYFWGLSQGELAMLATLNLTGGLAGVALAPVLGRALGKKRGALLASSTGIIVHIAPMSLRLLGLAPENDTTALFLLLSTDEFANATFAAASGILTASLIADVVEDAQVRTGRRSEGLLLSANTLVRKMVSGAGVFTATTILAFSQFPDDAKRGQVPESVLTALGLAYIPTMIGLYAIALLLLFAFNIDRRKHEANLETLRSRGFN